MARSCESLFTAMLAAVAGAIVAGAALACEAFAAGDVTGPGVAGALCAGRLACGGRTGGLGPKNFAHRMITPKESSEATRIRSSGVNLSFCPGALTSAPQFSKLSLQLNWSASLPISPEPGHNQICARADGSAAAVSIPAKPRAPRQIVRSPHRHSANTSAQTGNFPRTKSTNTFCRVETQTARASLPHVSAQGLHRPFVCCNGDPLNALQHAQQIRRQRCKFRLRHRTLRVYDDVPSCRYLQPVVAHDLAQAP